MKLLTVLVVILAACLNVTMGSPVPRTTLVKTEDLPVTNVVEQKNRETIPREVAIPGRVWCQHDGEEASEDVLCQRHCLPKGYSFGLCTKNTCSCI